MTYQIRVSHVLLLSSLYIAPITAAEQSEPGAPAAQALTFFDYLGAMVEDEQGWVDPLTLLEEPEELEEPQQASDTKDVAAEPVPPAVPVEEVERP